MGERLNARLEKMVLVCPQCEGEGGYADGLDDAACHTDCTRCAGNGWLADAPAILRAIKLARQAAAKFRKEAEANHA